MFKSSGRQRLLASRLIVSVYNAESGHSMPEKTVTSKNGNGNKDKPTSSDVNKASTVVKQFVVDCSREDYKPLMEQEVNGLTYRYVTNAKARFYDTYNRTFTAQDPILDPSQYDLREYVKEPMTLVQYLYVAVDAVIRVDLLSEKYDLSQGSVAHIVIL